MRREPHTLRRFEDFIDRAAVLIEFAGIKILVANQSPKLCCLQQFALAIAEDFLIEHNYERVARPCCCDIEKTLKLLLFRALDRVFQILRFVFFGERDNQFAIRGRFMKCG